MYSRIQHTTPTTIGRYPTIEVAARLSFFFRERVVVSGYVQHGDKYSCQWAVVDGLVQHS